MSGEQARELLRRARCGALATALAADAGRPYASLVTVAADWAGAPILLFSELSDHTRNLAADPRASLLIDEAQRRANPQTGARVALVGRIVRRDDDRAAERRFLARHPGARIYAGFADFHVHRFEVERAHFVGGFGRAGWLTAEETLSPAPDADAAAAAEDEALAALADDDGAIVGGLARSLGLKGVGWRAIAVDPDGVDLRRRSSFARAPFAAPARTAGDVRAAVEAWRRAFLAAGSAGGTTE